MAVFRTRDRGEGLLDHIGAKIACLIVAGILWAQVANNAATVQEQDLPLELRALPDSLVVRSQSLPADVRVRLTGSRFQFLLDDVFRRDKGRVVVDLSSAQEGLNRIELNAGDVLGPARAEEVLSPQALSLTVTRLMVRRLPVRMTPEGSLPEGSTLSGRPEITPPEVEVRGPAPVVRTLDDVRTAPVALGRRRSSFREQVQLKQPDPDVRLHPIEVVVEVGVDRVVERSFMNIPVRVFSEMDPSRVHIEPSTAKVRLSGAAQAVEALAPEELGVVLQLGVLAPGVYQREAELVLPSGRGIEGGVIEPARFQVVVEGAGGRR